MLKTGTGKFSYALKLFQRPLNPYRRNYNDQVMDFRSDRYAMGRIILPKSYAEREPNHSYKVQAADLVFKYLAKQTKGFSITSQDYEKHKLNSWYVYGVKIDQHQEQILDILADGHVLREHAYRHGVEKIQRK